MTLGQTIYPGMFIVVEGPNGSGKSTAMRALATRLQDRGREILSTREPGGSDTAEKLRALLLDPAVSLDNLEQLGLLNVGRRNHIRTVIIPALERGAIVLCDRFVASSLVFQTLHHTDGSARLSDQDILVAHRHWCDGFAPDLQLHLSAPIDILLARRQARAGEIDRFENGGIEYEQACRKKFAASGDILGFRTVDIDASADRDAVLCQMLQQVEPLVTGKSWSILSYKVAPDRSGRWLPVLDEQGRLYWSIDPSEAHRHANGILQKDQSLQMRFVSRDIAYKAYAQGGLTTDQVELARISA